jgi:16S rRNA C967 or C1407 C5-methylase (RsmB/RsmF family)/NOL1/NOP2/fmu family ribosome biogenesis protein
MSDLAPEFLQKMQRLLAAEYPDFLASLAQPQRVGLRLNPLKLPNGCPSAWAAWQLQPLAGLPNGYIVPDPSLSLGKHPAHATGCFYLQDPAAMWAAACLDPQPGEWVLDLCAAPGGKATHLAGLLAGTGWLLANEVQPSRAQALLQNIERLGVCNATITTAEPAHLATRLGAIFDRVLVDAPCSGEGMFRKLGAFEWRAALVQACSRRQQHILHHAAQLLRPGGRLLYATCTFSPEENEAVILDFLQQHPEFEVLPPPAIVGACSGRPDWLPSADQTAPQAAQLTRCVRLFPHRFPGEGHFLAILQKAGTPSPRVLPIQPAVVVPTVLKEFWQRYCATPLPKQGVAPHGQTWEWQIASTPNLSGLPVLRNGVLLGKAGNKHFEPAHAWATHARAHQIVQPFWQQTLPLVDTDLQAYWRGAELPLPNTQQHMTGWCVLTADDLPFGWGKIVSGRIKNHYPKGLRW